MEGEKFSIRRPDNLEGREENRVVQIFKNLAEKGNSEEKVGLF